MEKIVQHSRVLPAAPASIYGMYLDPAKHAAFTGGAVRVAATVGAAFEAFDGRIWGTILHLAPARQIVQSWRSFEWEPSELDSILTLTLWPDPDGTRIELAQVNVPQRLYPVLQANWPMRYFDPWQRFLQGR